MAEGAACERCGKPVSALALTMTDSSGSFSLAGVPDGASVRLVMETGKWRREITVPNVGGCKEIRMEDPQVMRLPRDASEGSLPRFAVVTGGADSLECLVRKIGIADSEFGTAGNAAAHVHLYHGAGGRSQFASGTAFAESSTVLADANKLKAYDVALVACAGRVEDARTVKPAWVAAMEAYGGLGGRAFFSHFMGYFVRGGSAALSSVASIVSNSGANLVEPFVADVDVSFPKGKLFAEWLQNVGASTTQGKIPINSAQYTVSSVKKANATPWIYGNNALSEDGVTQVGPVVQYFSANLPVGVPPAGQCGRYVVSDLHVGSDGAPGNFPTSCSSTNLTPQEKALEFMLFDLSSCVQEDSAPPTPPVIR
jgi:hypothetical protein